MNPWEKYSNSDGPWAKYAEKPSLADTAVSVVKSAINPTDFEAVKKVAQSASSITPKQVLNTLPLAGMAVGGIVGGIAGGVPTGGTMLAPAGIAGATLGGASGESARQLAVRASRKIAPNVDFGDIPEDSLGAIKEIAKQGFIGGASEAIPPLALKGILIPLARRISNVTGEVPVVKGVKELANWVLEKINKTAGSASEGTQAFTINPKPTTTRLGEEIANQFGESYGEVGTGEAVKKSYEKGMGNVIEQGEAKRAEIISKQLAQAQEGLDRKMEAFKSSYGAGTTNPRHGEAVKKEFDATVQSLKDIGNKKWDMVEKSIGKNKVIGDIKVDIGNKLGLILKDAGFGVAEKPMGRKLSQGQVQQFSKATNAGVPAGWDEQDILSVMKQTGGTRDEVLSSLSPKPTLTPTQIAELSVQTPESLAIGELNKTMGAGKLVQESTVRDVSAVNQIDRMINLLENPDLTIGDLLKNKRILSERSGDLDVMAKGMQRAYRRAASVLDDAVGAFAKQKGQRAILKDANAFSRDFINFRGTDIFKGVENASPEEVINNVVKSNNPTDIKTLFKYLSEDGKNYVRRGFLDKLSSSKSFNEAIGKYSPDTIVAVFGKRTPTVMRLSALEKQVSELPTYIKGSETAKLLPAQQKAIQIITSKAPSEIADALMGSPEIADAAVRMLDNKTLDILQRGWIDNVFKKATVIENGVPRIDQRQLLSILSPKNYSDEHLNALFRENDGFVKALRDVASYTANLDEFASNVKWMLFRPLNTAKTVIDRFNLGSSIGKELENNLKHLRGTETMSNLKNIAFPQMNKTKQVLSGAIKASSPSAISGENKR